MSNKFIEEFVYCPKNASLGIGTEFNRDRLVLNNIIQCANEIPCDFLDCSWKYGNEAMIGLALKDIKKNNMNFDLNIKFQSKVWHSQYAGGITKSLKFTLQKIGAIETIDFYLLHTPAYERSDTLFVWKQLLDCQRNLLVKTIGVCEFDQELLEFIHDDTGVYPEVLQLKFTISEIDYGVVNFCREKGISVQAYDPLHNSSDLSDIPLLVELTKKYGCDMEELILSFYMNQNITPIPVVGERGVDVIKKWSASKNIILEKTDLLKMIKLG